ncbi:MAG: AraC family transcriptional regulator [Ewingella sp.]|uniref:AraC family transcriptional regulator n=1 Tax=Ewingella TaxID=41201 RepID=UPI0018248CDC|nr:AraC family transcriptional regulator [Pseudomonas reactans]
MDPLSELLSLLKPQSYASGGVAIGREMAIQWPEHAGIKCYAVVSGQCWLSVEGAEGPIELNAGDCYLLPPGAPFVIATDLQAAPIDFAILREARLLGQNVLGGGTEACFLVGGHFVLTGLHADLLLGSLPPVVHIQQEADKAAMRWSLERMALEVREPQPGGSLITQQLAYMMLIQALRLHLHDGKNSGVGWLFALADKQLSTALACMHNNPEHRWTLESLAAHVGMSRSAFAKHFKDIVGSAPIEYLTHWRMLLACDRLKNSADSIPRIATSLGYESESAFGKAFKRVIGCSPRQHR